MPTPPPLEIHQKTGSIGVDNELSLLSSPKEHEDQAMDLFLNHVAEYNAQHISFEQQASSSSIGNKRKIFFLKKKGTLSSSFNTCLLLLLVMDPAQVLAQQKVKQEPVMPKEEAQQKKGKQKSKDNSHSLLHVTIFFLHKYVFLENLIFFTLNRYLQTHCSMLYLY